MQIIPGRGTAAAVVAAALVMIGAALAQDRVPEPDPGGANAPRPGLKGQNNPAKAKAPRGGLRGRRCRAEADPRRGGPPGQGRARCAARSERAGGLAVPLHAPDRGGRRQAPGRDLLPVQGRGQCARALADPRARHRPFQQGFSGPDPGEGGQEPGRNLAGAGLCRALAGPPRPRPEPAPGDRAAGVAVDDRRPPGGVSVPGGPAEPAGIEPGETGGGRAGRWREPGGGVGGLARRGRLQRRPDQRPGGPRAGLSQGGRRRFAAGPDPERPGPPDADPAGRRRPGSRPRQGRPTGHRAAPPEQGRLLRHPPQGLPPAPVRAEGRGRDHQVPGGAGEVPLQLGLGTPLPAEPRRLPERRPRSRCRA